MRHNYKSILEAINKAVYTVLSTDIQD